MRDRSKTESQRRRKRVKPPLQITELHTSKAERIGAEEALRESEERYRAIFEQAADSIVLIDGKSGALVEFNNRTCESLGYTREEFQKLKIPDFEVIESAGEVSKHIEKIIRQGSDVFETKHRTKDGRIRDILVSSKAIRIHGKDFVQSIWRDITERKQAQDEVKQAKECYDRLTDNADEAIFRVNATGGEVIYANTAAERIFGYSQEEWLADKSLGFKIIHPDYRDKQKQIHEEIVAKKETMKNVVLGWIAKDGRKVIVEYTIIPVHGKDGEILYFESIGRDITERKRTEQALQESQERFNLAIEGSNDGIWDWPDVNKERLWWSPRLYELLGYESDEFESTFTKFEEMLHPDDKDKVIQAMRDHLENHREYDFRFRMRTKGGEYHWFRARGQALWDDDGKPLRMAGSLRDITDYIEAQEALRGHKEELQVILDSVPAAIWYKDTNNTIIRANKAAAQSMDMEPEDLEGKAVSELFPADAQHYYEDDLEVIKSGKPKLDIIERLQLPSGENRWLHTDKVPYRDKDGNVAGVIAFVQDITERKRAEEETRIATEQLSLSIENMLDGYALHEAIFDDSGRMTDFRYLQFNPAAQRIVNISSEKIIGRTALELFPHIVQRGLMDKYADVMATGEPTHIDDFYCEGDKLNKAFDVSCFRLDEKHFVCIFRDITERRKAQEELGESEERFRRAVIESPFPIMIHADDGQVFQISKVWTELTGYTPEEIPTLSDWTERAYGERKDIVKSRIDKIFEFDSRVDEGEYIISAKDGKTLIWDFSSAPLGKLPDGRRLVISMAMDVTERKGAQAEREKLMEVLIEKNRELEEIIRVATHDLRTPMVNIEGFAQILATSCEQLHSLTEKQKIPAELSKQLDEVVGRDIPEAVGIINSGVSKMKSLLDGLLRVAKLGYSATRMVELDMNAKLAKIVDTMKFQVERSGAQIKIDKPLPSCLGDQVQINQVFSNLLANALKYLDPSRPGLVRITGWTEENYSVYCVEDNGIGIEADEIGNIFRMFYRIGPAGDDGEGLGLAIVRRIVNRHHGEVWVESERGKGSKFFVKLPRQ